MPISTHVRRTLPPGVRRHLRTLRRRLRAVVSRLLRLFRRTAPAPRGAKDRFLAGRELETAKDWEGAAAQYRAAIRARGSVAGWHVRLGRVLERTEGWGPAAEAYERAVALEEPPRPNALARLALAYRTLGRLDEADEVLARGLEADPENRQLLIGSAEVAMSRRDWPVAWGRWQQVDKLGQDLSANVLVRMSISARQVRAYDEAHTLLDRALAVDEGNLAVLTERANLRHRRMVRRTIGQEFEEAGSTAGSEGWRAVIDAWSELARSDGGRLSGLSRERFYEAQLYLVDELATEGSPEAAGRAAEGILRSLGEHGAVIPPTVQARLAAAVVAARTPGDLDPTEQQVLVDQLLALPADAASTSSWLVLYELALWNGLWRCATACRDRAVEAAQVGAVEGRSSLVRGVRAAIDRADFDGAAQLVDAAERDGRQQAALTWLRAHYHLSAGEVERSRHLLRDQLTVQDAPFADYVRGRSIAVVGPAPSGEVSGEEIDGFDVVVRCNYRGTGRMPDPAVFGSRTDVSYFNDTDSLGIDPDRTAALVGELDHAVLKSITRDDQRELVRQGRLRSFRISRELVLRTPNSIQNAILDLHRFEPSRIKVFHANLFLTDEPYFAAYRPDRSEQASTSLRRKLAFGLHDPLSQLTLTRNLWQAGAIEVDARLAEVLSLTNEGYMVGMERIYGRPVVRAD